MRKHLFGLLLLGMALFDIAAQQAVSQGLHLGIGPNTYPSEGGFNGCGLLLNAGWHKTDQSLKGRFAPDLTMSFNNGDCLDGVGSATFTSLSLRTLYNYDFIQADRFSIFIGGGGIVNFTSGGVDSPALSGAEITQRNESRFDLGLGVNIGFRFTPKANSGLGFELIPVNVQFGFDRYTELFFMGRFFYTLGRRQSTKATKP